MRSTLWTLLLFNVDVVVMTSAGLTAPVRREAMISSMEEDVDNRLYSYHSGDRVDHLGKQVALGSPQVRAHSETASVEPAPEKEKKEVSRAVQGLRQLPPPLNGVKREWDEEGERFEGLGADDSKGTNAQMEESSRLQITSKRGDLF